MPLRGRTNLGRHTPATRRCRRMRGNVTPTDQADVSEPAENEMLFLQSLPQAFRYNNEDVQNVFVSLPQAFRYNNEDVQNVFVLGTLRAQCIHCTTLKCLN